MRLMKDDILRDTILEYFASGCIPKRTKSNLTKDWLEAVKKHLSTIMVELHIIKDQTLLPVSQQLI